MLRHVPVDALAADRDGAAVLCEQSAQNGNGRGFARTVDAEKGEQLALPDVKGQVADGMDVREALVQVLNFYNVFHLFFSFSRRSGDWRRSASPASETSGTG